MNKIEMDGAAGFDSPPAKTYEERVILGRESKKKRIKGFLNYAGITFGVFIVFAVIAVVTTDVTISTFEDWAAIGLDFFLLLFCSYAMYVSCADSGMRAGLLSEVYTSALSKYGNLKKKIIDLKIQDRLSAFCRYYVVEELKHTRMDMLVNVGLSYELYAQKYLAADEETIERDKSLTKTQKAALIAANKVEPVRLTPDMIIKRGRGGGGRAPLGWSPQRKKYVNYGVKFLKSLVVSLVLSMIVLDISSDSTWLMISSCCVKLLIVVTNGFGGYRYGFENIAFDTVNYIDDQTDLIEQFLQWEEASRETAELACVEE